MGLLEPWSFGFLTFPKTCQDFKRKNETELSCSLSHHRRIPFREKILWTGISLFVFLVCCQIPILGCKMLQLHTHTHILLRAKVAVLLAMQFMHRQEVPLVSSSLILP